MGAIGELAVLAQIAFSADKVPTRVTEAIGNSGLEVIEVRDAVDEPT
jgi:hypothetical protein